MLERHLLSVFQAVWYQLLCLHRGRIWLAKPSLCGLLDFRLHKDQVQALQDVQHLLQISHLRFPIGVDSETFF